MTTFCLVSCVKSKAREPKKARVLYTSSLFEKARDIAEDEFDRWFVLSAKHGLVRPEEVIEPYEQTLNRMTKQEKVDWAERVFRRLRRFLKAGDTVTFFAGINYRNHLAQKIEEIGCRVSFPLEGMSIGNQLRWLSFPQAHRKVFQDIDKFYQIIQRLEVTSGEKCGVATLSGKSELPRKGVYLFFEPGECRRFHPDTLRVTRVGTHAVSAGSKSSLWNRLKTHIGTSAGGGNHRGSIFRLHIGNSYLHKNGRQKKYLSWGMGQTGSKEHRRIEEPVEQFVSSYISQMSVLWVAVDDEPGPNSDRAYIEKNAIGLLSYAVPYIDRPSREWLGNFALKESIRDSGLWNVNYVGSGYDPNFLDVLDTYVGATTGEVPMPDGPIAERRERGDNFSLETNQMNLFAE